MSVQNLVLFSEGSFEDNICDLKSFIFLVFFAIWAPKVKKFFLDQPLKKNSKFGLYLMRLILLTKEGGLICTVTGSGIHREIQMMNAVLCQCDASVFPFIPVLWSHTKDMKEIKLALQQSHVAFVVWTKLLAAATSSHMSQNSTALWSKLNVFQFHQLVLTA